VAQAELGASERVLARDVGGAVVCHHALDADAAVGKPAERAAQEGDRGLGGERVEHLGVGQPGVVVDHHVHVFEAGLAAAMTGTQLASAVTDDAVAGAARADPAELLDVDVHQLARTAALIAARRLGRLEPRTLPEPDPPQPPRHRRERQPQRLGDLRSRHAQPAQRHDRGHQPVRQPPSHPLRRRRAILKRLARRAATHPLARRHHAHAGGLGRRRERPTLLQHPPSNQRPALRTGPRVSVQLHPVPSLGLSGSTPSASKEARMKQRP
jgi:hypothetical protein